MAPEAGDVGGLPGYNGQGLDSNSRLGNTRVLPNLPLEGPPDRGGSLVGQLRRLSESLERQEPPRKGTEPPCCKGYFDRIRLKVSYLDHFCFFHIAPLAHQNDRKPVLYAARSVRLLLVFFSAQLKTAVVKAQNTAFLETRKVGTHCTSPIWLSWRETARGGPNSGRDRCPRRINGL